MESNPLTKSSKYSPGRFPPGEKEKEEGVDGGEGKLVEEEDCSIRGGVELPDPILVSAPLKPSPTELPTLESVQLVSNQEEIQWTLPELNGTITN
jgi:hypothetical protein